MMRPADAGGPSGRTTGESLLTITGLSKSFPGVRALDAVDFDLGAGEIHALARAARRQPRP